MIPLDFLREERVSEHFVLRYGLRDPADPSQSAGLHGIRRDSSASVAFEALDMAFGFLLSPPVSLPHPTSKIPIHILDIGSIFFTEDAPFTSEDEVGNPYIILPSRSDAPVNSEEDRHLAAAACHEAFHAVVWKGHPLRSVASKLWRWFHEGCAVWTERQVLPDNPDYLRFAMNWCDRPDIPLDDERALYESAFFVRYIVNRYGPSILGQIWQSEYLPGQGPLGILRNLHPGNWDRLLPDYFLNAFFLQDPNCLLYSPDVFERYGRRAVSRVLQLQPGSYTRVDGELDHLACRYYLVVSPAAPKISLVQAEPELLAEVAGVDERGCRLKKSGRASCWLVVVSNCGMRFGSDDKLSYGLEVTIP